MKLTITQQSVNTHKDVCTAIGWSVGNELFSCSDDGTIWRWSINGEPLAKVCDLDALVTDMHWFPCSNKRQQAAASDIFVVGCADGSFKLISKSGRLEKSVDAHTGAIVSLRWNHDGTALVTGGEDGLVKVWSRAGMLRSTLASAGKCVYCVAWSPDSDHVLFTSGRDLIIKPLQPSSKQLQWKAHEGSVLKADWNPLNNMIVSCGEDGRYRVWDSYGRQLYQSSPFEYSITSVSWSPDGELFAVGSFNMLRVCDKTGWSCSRVVTSNTGSLLNLAWTSDSTQLAGAGGSGAVVFGHIVERSLEWKNLIVSLVDSSRVQVQDVLNETIEELDFRDKVIKMAFGHGHLVVATATQCCIYDVHNWNTPHMFDLKDTVNLVLQSSRYFALVDNVQGIQIYNYDGRLVSNPRPPGLKIEFLNSQSISLTSDALAVLDTADRKVVRLFDAATGRPLGGGGGSSSGAAAGGGDQAIVRHHMEVVEIALDQYSAHCNDRKLALIDRNRDLYVTLADPQAVRGGGAAELYKLATMVDSMKWSDETDMLAAVSDARFCVWLYPNVVYVDRDLLNATRYIRADVGGELGKGSQLLSFSGARCTARRSDGAVLTCAVSPHPLVLYEHVERGEWEAAIRLCRFVRDPAVWACLAAMAVHAGELNTAEISFAAIDEADKLEYMLRIKEIPSPEGRQAELLLYRRRVAEAEAVLLHAGLLYRAIKMHIRLFNWERALDLAINYKTHVDTVLAHRARHLERFGREESMARFQQYAQGLQIDWEKIKAKAAQEKEKESQRPGARPYA